MNGTLCVGRTIISKLDKLSHPDQGCMIECVMGSNKNSRSGWYCRRKRTWNVIKSNCRSRSIKGPRARVDKGVCAGIDSVSIASFCFFFSWFLRYSTLIFWVLMEVVGTTCIYLFASIGTQSLLHSLVINTGTGRDILIFFARSNDRSMIDSCFLHDASKTRCLSKENNRSII